MKQDKELISEAKIIVTLLRTVLYLIIVFVILGGITIFTIISNSNQKVKPERSTAAVTPVAAERTDSVLDKSTALWKAPDTSSIPSGEKGSLIRYGKNLVVHTSEYLGPMGSVAKISNGMNCQNCHLEAGTKSFGLNFSVFISQYPKLSGRSGKVEPAHERINECMERSMNGKRLKPDSKEMKAILAYMAWIGADRAAQKSGGQSVETLPFMSRAADPLKGRMVYLSQCQTCHGENGQGLLVKGKNSFTYPPLWGAHSYNDGAGMYRLTNFAGFVKNNMPLGVTYKDAQLSDQDAWDVAAYVNAKPRPHRDQRNDYKKTGKKPIDFPFGPYQDSFSEQQHKFGPFAVIKSAQNTSHKKL